METTKEEREQMREAASWGEGTPGMVGRLVDDADLAEELLEALENVVAEADAQSFESDPMNNARAAIAKARSER